MPLTRGHSVNINMQMQQLMQMTKCRSKHISYNKWSKQEKNGRFRGSSTRTSSWSWSASHDTRSWKGRLQQALRGIGIIALWRMKPTAAIPSTTEYTQAKGDKNLQEFEAEIKRLMQLASDWRTYESTRSMRGHNGLLRRLGYLSGKIDIGPTWVGGGIIRESRLKGDVGSIGFVASVKWVVEASVGERRWEAWYHAVGGT